MNRTVLLLPGGFRPLGLVLSGVGMVLVVIRFYFGIKPELLNLKVFAFYSNYLETKIFVLIQNQFLEEVAGLIIIVGLFFIAMAKEYRESDETNALRLRAFIITTYVCTIFLVVSMLFTFGFGFVFMMIVNLGLWQLTYIIVFRILLKTGKESGIKSIQGEE